MNARKRVEMKQFSDCDFPSTKEEVKMEEVKLRGDTSYRYEGIAATDMKDQWECPYCGKTYLD